MCSTPSNDDFYVSNPISDCNEEMPSSDECNDAPSIAADELEIQREQLASERSELLTGETVKSLSENETSGPLNEQEEPEIIEVIVPDIPAWDERLTPLPVAVAEVQDDDLPPACEVREASSASEEQSEVAPVSLKEEIPSEISKQERAQVALLQTVFQPALLLMQWRGKLPQQKALSLALLVLILLGMVAPLLLTAGYGYRAYATYNLLKVRGESGAQHLLRVKTIFSGAKNSPSSVLDPARLTLAKQEFVAARTDFAEVQSMLDKTDLIQAVSQYLPQYRSKVVSARAVSQMGIDISDVGQQLTETALTLAPRLKSPLLSDASTPLFTQADVTLIRSTLNSILPRLDNIQAQARLVSLDDLPISPEQRTQVTSLLHLLPQVRALLSEGHGMLDSLGWLLGADQPRSFLIQTMDRAELRATGGFTGQYGELRVNGGRVEPFTLKDIALVEYADNSPVTGNQAPEPYRSWWPFANWGLRDSNLSADFPTSARLAIQQYKQEMKRDVDGVILFTPFLIGNILQAVGPITIPKYNETITAQNLEERLHYYQLDNKGIRKIEIIEHVEDPAVARKLFTSEVARALMERVRQSSPEDLAHLAQQMFQALKTRDLQVYLTNQHLEDLLMKYGYAGEVDRSQTHDGLYIVQTNVSASKASQYVQTSFTDKVTLDDKGGARHDLQMRFVYKQLGTVYGLDTYRNYVRVYVPPDAKFLSGHGFDSDEPLCGGPFGACPAENVYPDGELVCPPGGYDAGFAAPMLNDPYAGGWHPLNKLGSPTNFKSDVSERAMFGGYVVIPKDCTLTASLSWYVPATSNSPYSLLVQRQAATFPNLDLMVQPSADICQMPSYQPLRFAGSLTEDTLFSLRVSHAVVSRSARCDA